MPTQTEIDAATIAIDTMNPAPVCTADIACVALAAAEAVRARLRSAPKQADLAAAAALDAAGYPRLATDVREGKLRATPDGDGTMWLTPTDQRMTQTHAPLAGWKRTRDQSG